MPELWLPALGLTDDVVRTAVAAEAAGWDGVLVPESPKAAPDPFVDLALAARETSTLRLGVGVTNPVTRIALTLACAAATVQHVSGGRLALLGIGRGDSALAHLGMAPAPVAHFERYVRRLQAYLRGERLAHDLELDGLGRRIPPVATLGMVDEPARSRLAWLPPDVPKVPLAVAATGPRVLALGAVVAEEVLLAAGAALDRVRWSVETAREAREAAGLDPDGLGFSAFVTVIPCDDPAEGRSMAAGNVASFARFTAMHGRVAVPVSPEDAALYRALHDAYTMRGHGKHGSPQSRVLTDDFIDRFAVIGTAEHCARRLAELAAAGIDRFVLLPPGVGHDATDRIRRRLETEVIPAVREACGVQS